MSMILSVLTEKGKQNIVTYHQTHTNSKLIWLVIDLAFLHMISRKGLSIFYLNNAFSYFEIYFKY